MCRCSRQLFALAYRMAKMVHPRRTDGEHFSHPEHFQGHPYEYFACSRLIYPEVRRTRVGRLAPELDLWRDDAVEWGSAFASLWPIVVAKPEATIRCGGTQVVEQSDGRRVS